MIFNWMKWPRDNNITKLHPTQKPIPLLKKLISIFTDAGDVVIDPVAGSGTTLRAAFELNRNSYGFEIDKVVYKNAKEKMLKNMQIDLPMNSYPSITEKTADIDELTPELLFKGEH